MSAPTLNEHQVAELHRFVKAHAEDEDVSASFGERPHPINRLAWYDCEVPGTVAVLDADGFVMKVLLPVPRPVNRDPLFQPAGAVSDYRKLAVLIMSRREFLRDLQWAAGVVMDAPDTMPAGACEYMSASEEAFGAMQMTWDRPGRWDDTRGVGVAQASVPSSEKT